jgi:hypothetical protein
LSLLNEFLNLYSNIVAGFDSWKRIVIKDKFNIADMHDSSIVHFDFVNYSVKLSIKLSLTSKIVLNFNMLQFY